MSRFATERSTGTAVSRRQFLRGDVRGRRAGVRPPWVLPEPAFADRCTRCDDCIAACPSFLLTRGSGGYPEMDFGRGGCDFCGKCRAACRAGAFQPDGADRSVAWSHRAVVAASCLSAQGVVCRTCADHCEARAIRFRPALGGRSFAQVDVARCNGCGACVGVCPAGAVTMQIPVPAEAVA
jgi:ferredoxin-type protein NapF